MNTMKLFDLTQSAKMSYPWINSTESGLKVEHGRFTILLTPREEKNTFLEKTYLSTVAADRWQVWNFLKSYKGWKIEIQPETEKETEEETETKETKQDESPETLRERTRLSENEKEPEEERYHNISEDFEEEEEED